MNRFLYPTDPVCDFSLSKEDIRRRGLADDWDKFMFFEVHPKHSVFLEQIEAFTIRTFASLIENDVAMFPLNESGIKPANRWLIGK